MQITKPLFTFNTAYNFAVKRLKVKVKITLEQAMNAQRGSEGIALLLL
jgi:hypothetical protein